MSMIGQMSLLVAFAAVIVALVCLSVGNAMRGNTHEGAGETLVWGGHIATLLIFAALTVACGVLVVCFLTGDTSIEYVVHAQSKQVGLEGLLYRIAGLWEGREGSLLFWAWLISLFGTIMALRNMKKTEKLDSWAIFVLVAVLAGFVGILLFSDDNSPFRALDAQYLDAAGNLKGAATLWGMNTLLEHWAMAIHPPTLFVGYAGLTVPFAYAVAALICGDGTDAWVRASQRYTMVSWWFLTIGIGLGAIWAYVVLGWGGYWGWDPVENASLLPWLVGVALIHSFTVYRQRGAFKRWGIMCACITFAFVILGTFISRSGLIESVHAFEGDPVSLALFGTLIIASIAVGIVGLLIRWKRFAPAHANDEEVESLFSRSAAYYFNNVIMMVFAAVVCYLTVASALPTWLPFGGTSVSTGTYNAIARPLGIFYLAVLAVCPLLGWAKTDRAKFLRDARVPAVCALVLFVALMVYLVTYLGPSYDAIIAAGGTAGEGLASEGPAAYYKGLAAVGFLVASLLFFNTLFMIGRACKSWAAAHTTNPFVAFFQMWRENASRIGGYIAHLGMAVILIGLICSSMFVTEVTDYIAWDEEADTAEDFTIQEFTLKYTGNRVYEGTSGNDMFYEVHFDVYRDGAFVGSVQPSMQLVMTTQQTKANAAVISFPEKDLFVVYRGVNDEGDFSMDVRVNPQITLVWIGFGMLVLGGAVAALGGRAARKRKAKQAQPVTAASAESADTSSNAESVPDAE